MKFLLSLALLFCGTVHANSIKDWLDLHGLTIEASVGHTQFTKTNNTLWYQEGFTHQLDMQSQSYSIGVSGYVADSTRWRVEYTRLGNVTTQADAVSDANYNGSNGCKNPCDPLSIMRTEGSVRGFSFTLAPEMRVSPNIKLFVEAGAFVFLPKFYADSTYPGAANYRWTNEYRAGWVTKPQIGIGGSYKNMQLVLTAYNVDAPTPDVDAIPNWSGWAYNIKGRYQF